MTAKRKRRQVGPAIAVVLLIGFLAAGVLADRHEGTFSGGASEVTGEVDTIAKRVEQIRGLRFDKLPDPVVVTPEETRDYALKDLDRSYPPERRQTDEELLTLLGLIPPGTDLRAVSGDVSEGQVAGFYDPRTNRLAVVSGGGGAVNSNSTIAEITLAHELTHALEDDRFGIDEPDSGADDRATAYTALVEGTATSTMNDYAARYISPGAALSTAFSALGALGAAEGIPDYLQRSLEFSYTGGEQFVAALRAEGDGWKLVNRALRDRPPVSTEQVIHPEKYLDREQPEKVAIGDLGLGEQWKRRASGTIGELDTSETLRLGMGDADARLAAAGWGGGRYQLWTDEQAAEDCDAPCRRADVLVLRWTWDTPVDAREFDAALPLYVTRGLEAKPAGPAQWSVGDGGAAIAVDGLTTTLAFAPTPAEAARVAGLAGG